MAATHFSGPVVSSNGATITGATATDTLAVGGGTTIKKIFSSTFALDPASIGATTSTETSVTITGVAAGDAIFLQPPASLESGLAYSGVRVSGADTIQVRLSNFTGGAVDGSSRTWTYTWFDLT